MQERRYDNQNGHFKLSRLGVLALALTVVFTLGTLLTARAQAADMDGWPEQSRAERLGTFTYIYGGAGLVSHSGTADGREKYAGFVGTTSANVTPAHAVEDGDDIFFNFGFGVRMPNEFNLEVGAAFLNGAYDKPGPNNESTPQPEQPAFEVSVLKSFKLGGPPLMRYTARLGFASIDDPHTDDATFFGIGVAHEPFRVELRNYDFGVFESQVLQVTYI